MELILVKDIKKLGKIGNIVSVKSGYGRNYLLPQGFAILATAKNKANFENKRAEFEAQNHDLITHARDIANKIDQKEFVFIRQASNDGKLFGSVSIQDVVSKVSEFLSSNIVKKSHVILKNQIKNIGLYHVELSLHPEVHTNIIVVVGRTESEAMNILTEYSKKDSDIQIDEQELSILNNNQESDTNKI